MSSASVISLEKIMIAGDSGAPEASPRRVLDDRDIALLADVSSRLMRDPEAKALPDVMSFAFWCRKGHLKKLKEERDDLACSVGRGLSFHVAPSNVPVNFAFSWAFALLAGNACVVRVPSKPFPQVQVICRAIEGAMGEAGDTRSAFVSYPHDSAATERLSAVADVRVLWGGDATVNRIRAMGSKARCVDVAFADRFSIACFDAAAVEALEDSELASLAEAFYNDTYLMDQNACSSPMTICWINATDAGKKRFWVAVRSKAAASYYLQGAVVTDKYVQLCRDAIDGRVSGPAGFDGLLEVADIDCRQVGEGALSSFRGKGGYFYQMNISSVGDVLPLLDSSCQTVTYFGCGPEAIRSAVLDAGVTGIDRIVPVGKAMDIDAVWDGMDLLSMMSRRVDIR